MAANKLIGLIFAGVLSLSPLSAEVVVRVAPPHAIVETRGAPPSRNHVWISGYHRWDGNAYAWSPGRWEEPPHRGAHWVAHHWVHQRGGWVLVEGRWR